MVRFMDRLNEKMELLDEKIQNKAAKAGEDYLSFFESHAEEAYKEYYLYKCFRDLRQKARESGSPEKVLEYYPLRDYANMWNDMKSIVSSYNKIGKRNKTAMTHNKLGKHMAHTLRLECVQQLVEDYGHFIRILADTLRQQETRRDTRTLREKENRRGPKL